MKFTVFLCGNENEQIILHSFKTFRIELCIELFLLNLLDQFHDFISFWVIYIFSDLLNKLVCVRGSVPDCGIAPYVKSKMNSAPGRDSGVGGWFLLGAAQPRSEWVMRTENGAASAAKI